MHQLRPSSTTKHRESNIQKSLFQCRIPSLPSYMKTYQIPSVLPTITSTALLHPHSPSPSSPSSGTFPSNSLPINMFTTPATCASPGHRLAICSNQGGRSAVTVSQIRRTSCVWSAAWVKFADRRRAISREQSGVKRRRAQSERIR